MSLCLCAKNVKKRLENVNANNDHNLPHKTP
jgi:hypothetical protein